MGTCLDHKVIKSHKTPPDASGAAEAKRIGDLIRNARTTIGMTQGGLGQRAGLCKTLVAQLEAGERTLTAPFLLKVSEVLEVSFTAAVRGEDLSSAERQLLAAYRLLTPKQQAALLILLSAP